MVLPSGIAALDTPGLSAAAQRLISRTADDVDNQCPQGVPAVDGNACVVAVVRFKGSLLMNANVNITTWSPDLAHPAALRTSTSKYGVTIVQVRGPHPSSAYPLASSFQRALYNSLTTNGTPVCDIPYSLTRTYPA